MSAFSFERCFPFAVSLLALTVSPMPVRADHTTTPDGVALVGSLQSELGCPDKIAA